MKKERYGDRKRRQLRPLRIIIRRTMFRKGISDAY